MSPPMTAGTNEALMRLGASTAEAVAKALDAICSAPVERGDVGVVPGDECPFDGFDSRTARPSPSASRYVDGVTGGNIFVHDAGAASRRAGGGDDGRARRSRRRRRELTELELSAVGEATNQMMAAAASATGVVLGQEVEIAPPETRFFATPAEAREAFERRRTPSARRSACCGEPCRLVQLVPNAFVVRMTRALDEQGTSS